MHRNIEEITTELSGLPRQERLEVARFLLDLDDQTSSTSSCDRDGDSESAWEKEISARVKAVENGTAEGVDFDHAIRSISKRFT